MSIMEELNAKRAAQVAATKDLQEEAMAHAAAFEQSANMLKQVQDKLQNELTNLENILTLNDTSKAIKPADVNELRGLLNEAVTRENSFQATHARLQALADLPAS